MKETIKEIKTIHLELLPDNGYSISINGGGTNEVEYRVPADNYHQWARIFTRLAMEMWANMDATLNQKEEQK
jgi:hypothetical protein